MRRLPSIAAVAAGCVAACPAQELVSYDGNQAESRDPLHETGDEREHLLGDWNGLRTRMVERGVHFQFGYIGEVFGNVSGGVRRDAVYEGLGEMALNIDLDRLTGAWRGGSFRVSSLWLHGDGPSELAGDVLTASNIDGHDSIRLYELWFEQNFFDDVVSLRAGNLLADEEFAGTDFGGRLLNSGFGWPAFVSGNVINTGPAFYVASPGARLRIEPNAKWYFQTAIYDGDSFDSDAGDPEVNESGTRFRLSSSQGLLSMTEIGWRRNAAEAGEGLPGTYKLGGWIHTGDFGRHNENFGFYVAAEQMVWREKDEQGLGAFLRVGGSPPRRSLLPLAIDGGVHYTGLIPGRDRDHFALGVVYGDLSDQRRGHDYFEDHEMAVEVTYEFVVTPWWNIQPDVQWIGNPGGRAGAGHALLLGLRSTLTF
jgi:porin